MHGDRRAPSDRHHAVPEYLGAYGARHPPVHFSGDLLLHVLPQGAVTVILFIVSDTNVVNLSPKALIFQGYRALFFLKNF